MLITFRLTAFYFEMSLNTRSCTLKFAVYGALFEILRHTFAKDCRSSCLFIYLPDKLYAVQTLVFNNVNMGFIGSAKGYKTFKGYYNTNILWYNTRYLLLKSLLCGYRLVWCWGFEIKSYSYVTFKYIPTHYHHLVCRSRVLIFNTWSGQVDSAGISMNRSCFCFD